MWESSSSQFFRTTTGPDAFEESRSSMTFLTILGIIQIPSILSLVLKEKAGLAIAKPPKLELTENISANNFCLIRCRKQCSRI